MTTRIIELPRNPPAPERTQNDIPVLAVAPFAATCPTCKDVRLQHGYTARSLSRLLGRHHAIEAFCVVCDEVWPISATDRHMLAERLMSSR